MPYVLQQKFYSTKYTLFFVFPAPLIMFSFSALNSSLLAVFTSTFNNSAALELFISLFLFKSKYSF